MLHPTYQHLEDRIRLAGLSLLQWAQLFVCALGAFGLSKLLPLPGSWSLSLAITVCGMPAAAAIAFMQADFDVRRWLLDALGFGRAPKRYLPGDGGRSRDGGYMIATDETLAVRGGADSSGERFDVEALWGPA